MGVLKFIKVYETLKTHCLALPELGFDRDTQDVIEKFVQEKSNWEARRQSTLFQETVNKNQVSNEILKGNINREKGFLSNKICHSRVSSHNDDCDEESSRYSREIEEKQHKLK